jgi:hypothetical protein
MVKIISLLLVLAASSFGQYADFASTGYSAGAAEYLKRPVSAQSAALAGAVVAWRENLAGAQYNPAILDATPSGTYVLNGTYTIMTLDRKHIGVDAAGTIGNYLACGISFMQYGVGNIEHRDDFGALLDSFDYSGNSLALSAAGKIVGNIALGGTVRYLFENFEKQNAGRANGIGFDLGATYEPFPMLCVGASVQNILSKLWWQTGYVDPVLPCVRLGVSGTFLKKSLQAEIDLIKTFKQPEEIALGIQYTFLEMFSLRGGISTDVDASAMHSKYPDYSFGLGVHYSIFGFNYAFSIPDSDLGWTHKISLKIEFKDLFK